MTRVLPCKICGQPATLIGKKAGKFHRTNFELFHCSACGYSFIGNPWLEYAAIYSEAYYKGQGADPYVDYVFELEHPEQTVREYEWKGILTVVRSLVPVSAQTKWLDFGCGNGGLARYVHSCTGCRVEGYEQGWIQKRAEQAGVSFLSESELQEAEEKFDIVTAVEVLEHLPEPLLVLQQIRSLLRPGGLFFYTTGNAEPHQNNFLRWSYVIPEIHISFFEPRTMCLALSKTGFCPQNSGLRPGFVNIVRFKFLKTLGVRRKAIWQKLLPWTFLARAIDKRLEVSAHPVGWANQVIPQA